MRELCHGVYKCYSCDRELSATAQREDASFLSYDHVWPHSFGGDSVEVNLLPSCQDCNTAKQHTISWEWGLVQSTLPQTELGEAELHSLRLTRASKIALHMRAALDYARMHGTTLKDGFLAVGPRLRTGSLLVILMTRRISSIFLYTTWREQTFCGRSNAISLPDIRL